MVRSWYSQCVLASAAAWLSRTPALRANVHLKQPVQDTLDGIITTSLDRHAQRGQKLGGPVDQTEISLSDATAADWCRVVDALAPFMKERRLRRLQTALDERRQGLELAVENVADPWNFASIARTAEGLGVQHIHMVEAVTHMALPSVQAHAS